MATALSQQRSLGPPPWHYAHNASSSSSKLPSTSSSSSSTSLSSSATPTNSSGTRRSPPSASLSPPSRKIRFAPLPDPRRSVLITDDGEELPIPNGDSATAITSCPPSPAVFPVDLPVKETSSLSSVASSSKRNSDGTEPSASGSTTPSSMTTTTNSEASTSAPPSPLSIPIPLPPLLPQQQKTPTPAAPSQQSGWPKSKGLSFSRIFGKRRGSASSGSSSANTLTPTTSIETHPHSSRKGISTEEILTLGTINLFRTSSRDSSDGWNLTRWTSAGPSTSGGPARNFGVPLTRTQSTQSTKSTQSYKSKTPSLLSGLRPSTSPKVGRAAPNRRGARMLNGRVYGSKPNANPFANARDEEPSFVEWGYGGMGSVKGAKSAGVAGAGWEKLGTAPDDDLEDSTGMAWLKKRREEREKKKAEEEAKAKAAEETKAEEKTEEDPAKGDEEKASSEAIADGEVAEAKVDAPTVLSAAPTLATITESRQPTPRASRSDLGHHRRTASLASLRKDMPSAPSTPRIPSSSTILRDGSSPLANAHTPAAEEEHEVKTMNIPMSRPHMRSRSASNATFTHLVGLEKQVQQEVVKRESESETESESSSSGSDREEDEDEDEEESQLSGKMVLGAGMEKIGPMRFEFEEYGVVSVFLFGWDLVESGGGRRPWYDRRVGSGGGIGSDEFTQRPENHSSCSYITPPPPQGGSETRRQFTRLGIPWLWGALLPGNEDLRFR